MEELLCDIDINAEFPIDKEMFMSSFSIDKKGFKPFLNKHKFELNYDFDEEYNFTLRAYLGCMMIYSLEYGNKMVDIIKDSCIPSFDNISPTEMSNGIHTENDNVQLLDDPSKDISIEPYIHDMKKNIKEYTTELLKEYSTETSKMSYDDIKIKIKEIYDICIETLKISNELMMEHKKNNIKIKI